MGKKKIKQIEMGDLFVSGGLKKIKVGKKKIKQIEMGGGGGGGVLSLGRQ